MLHIIDRYITKMFLTYFVAGLLVFVTIFLAVDFMSFFVRYDVSVGILLKYYGFSLPGVMYQLTPMACLLATVFTLSSLNKNSELVALFSVGMSLARVSVPILAVVGSISALSFWVGDRVLPGVNQKKNYIFYVDIKKRPNLYSTVKTGRIWYRSENVLFNIKTLDANNSRAQGLSLYYFDSAWNMVQMISAKDVEMKADQKWVLSRGTVTLFSEESSFPLTKTFQTKIITMNEDVADLQSSSDSSGVLSLGELNKFIHRNKDAGLNTLQYEVDYHSKFGFAFAAFVMSLMGIPFSVSRSRSGGTMANAGMCIALTFTYWALYSSALTLGKHGAIPPILAAWSPNLLMVGASIYFLVRLKK